MFSGIQYHHLSTLCDFDDQIGMFCQPMFVIPFFEPTSKQQHKTVLSRDFSQQNMLGFRNELGMTDWKNVTGKTSVDEAYDEFWNTYNGLYNRFFQLK